MKSSLELLMLGNQISKQYLEKNASMNESLEKIANEHGLNSQEMQRVAEQANVETYLALLSKSKDHYVEFPLANAAEVHEKVAGLTKQAEYEEATFDEYPDLDVPTYKNTMEKVAEEVTEEPKINEQGIIDYFEFLENEFLIKQAQLTKSLYNLYRLEKQALFHNTPSEVAHVIRTISPGVFALVEEEHFPKLAEEFYDKDFTKIAELDDVEFEPSPFTEAVRKVDNDLGLVMIIAQEQIGNLEKYAGVGKLLLSLGKRIGKSVVGTGRFIKKYPRISTGLMVGGVTIPTAYHAGKEMQKTYTNALTEEQNKLVEEVLRQKNLRLL